LDFLSNQKRAVLCEIELIGMERMGGNAFFEPEEIEVLPDLAIQRQVFTIGQRPHRCARLLSHTDVISLRVAVFYDVDRLLRALNTLPTMSVAATPTNVNQVHATSFNEMTVIMIKMPATKPASASS